MGSKLNPIFTFPKSCQHSKLCSSKTSGGVTTSLKSAVFLLSYNASPSFIARYILELQLLKVPSSSHAYHGPGLAHSCCKVMTPQFYKYIGTVGSHLNYLQSDYGVLTGSSARNRASTKTHFESRLHVDLANLCDTVQVHQALQATVHCLCRYSPTETETATLEAY